VPIVEQQTCERIAIALVADPGGQRHLVTIDGEVALNTSIADAARAFYEGAVTGASTDPTQRAEPPRPPDDRFEPHQVSLLLCWNRGWLVGSRARKSAAR
jgi:hypothetical protein